MNNGDLGNSNTFKLVTNHSSASLPPLRDAKDSTQKVQDLALPTAVYVSHRSYKWKRFYSCVNRYEEQDFHMLGDRMFDL